MTLNVNLLLCRPCYAYCDYRDLHGDMDHGNSAGMEANVARFRGGGKICRGTHTGMKNLYGIPTEVISCID